MITLRKTFEFIRFVLVSAFLLVMKASMVIWLICIHLSYWLNFSGMTKGEYYIFIALTLFLMNQSLEDMKRASRLLNGHVFLLEFLNRLGVKNEHIEEVMSKPKEDPVKEDHHN